MDMTPDECAAVVELMGSFTVTKSQRKDVHGRSQAVGWTDFRQLKRVAAATMMDHMVHLQLRINAMISKYFPDFEWTTLMLNDTTRSDPHVDQGNVGMSVAIIVMPPTGVATAGRSGAASSPQGMLMYVDDEPEVVARPGQIALFSGHRMHMSSDYDGKRYSIIAFHHKTFKHAPESVRQKLTSLGYRLPGTAPPPAGVATAGRPGDDEADKSDGGDDDYDGEDIWADEDDMRTFKGITTTDDDIHEDFALQMENTERRVDDAIDLMIHGVLDVLQSSRGVLGKGTGKGEGK
jgi:hypothetical protein